LPDLPQYDVLVLGAGAAGLFFAAHAARRGRSVLVLEHNPKPGRKILISGGGRCNFTNLDPRPDRFLSSNPHFAKSALARFTARDFLALVERYGIAWHEKKLGQLFCDGSSQQILDLLLRECREAGVELRCGARIHSVSKPASFRVETVAGVLQAAVLVVATGGPAIPKLGATGFAYDLARQFGLRVIPPRPALVPLTFSPTDMAQFSGLAGVAASVRASIGNRGFEEKMLFTHRGLSGPAILQISSYWNEGSAIRLNLVHGLSLADTLLHRKRSQDRVMPRSALADYLPERLAQSWMEIHPLDRPLFQAPDAALRRLAESLEHWQFHPAGTEGFEKAEVVAGGVDTDELDSKTMAVKRVPGLFFIGECVDVTGWLGGYNFQWAWASAFAAAQAV
jgi:predicted Rossmann fold flavoprotein